MSEPDRMLRVRAFMAHTGLSRSTLYRKIGEGSFPRQVKISDHGAGWRKSAIDCWMDDAAFYRVDVKT